MMCNAHAVHNARSLGAASKTVGIFSVHTNMSLDDDTMVFPMSVGDTHA